MSVITLNSRTSATLSFNLELTNEDGTEMEFEVHCMEGIIEAEQFFEQHPDVPEKQACLQWEVMNIF